MQNLFSLGTRVLNTCQNLVSTHAPQFRSKNVLFTLKLSLVMITLLNALFTYCRLASRMGGERKSLLCPQPFISSSAQWESADSPSVFLPICPLIRPRSKCRTGACNRFISPILSYKSPHRQCSPFIGQSFLCLLLPQAPKTLASSLSLEQMARNKHAGEGSSGAPPPLHPRLG
jgi:hypothetical protein